jgi:hypothetical protein
MEYKNEYQTIRGHHAGLASRQQSQFIHRAAYISAGDLYFALVGVNFRHEKRRCAHSDSGHPARQQRLRVVRWQ